MRPPHDRMSAAALPVQPAKGVHRLSAEVDHIAQAAKECAAVPRRPPATRSYRQISWLACVGPAHRLGLSHVAIRFPGVPRPAACRRAGKLTRIRARSASAGRNADLASQPTAVHEDQALAALRKLIRKLHRHAAAERLANDGGRSARGCPSGRAACWACAPASTRHGVCLTGPARADQGASDREPLGQQQVVRRTSTSVRSPAVRARAAAPTPCRRFSDRRRDRHRR